MQSIKKSHFFHALIALAGASFALQAQADSYSYQQVDYPGAPDTQIFGINNRGDAVGNGISAPDNFPFVYSVKKGTFTNVAPIAGFSATSILGISESGDKVGSVVSLDETMESGLVLRTNGTYTVFDHPGAFSGTQARGINPKGLITGFRDASDGSFVGFIYDSKKGTFTDIVPSRSTIAQGINARGDVVGSAIFLNADDPCPPSVGGTVRYGWLRKTDGTVTYFDVNGGRTSARGITDTGTVAGFVTDPFTGTTKGFVVTLDGSQCQSITVADADLLQFPGNDVTFVQGISNSGVVAGSTTDPSDTSHGFIAKKVK